MGIDEESFHEWSKTLRSLGLRSTPSTLATLRCFEASAQALSHDDLTHQLGSAAPDRVTLYRILERLIQVGILQKYTDSTRTQRFCLARHAPVGSFECDNCRHVVPITQHDELTVALDIIKSYLSRQGMNLNKTLLNSHGLCGNCNNSSPA